METCDDPFHLEKPLREFQKAERDDNVKNKRKRKADKQPAPVFPDGDPATVARAPELNKPAPISPDVGPTASPEAELNKPASESHVRDVTPVSPATDTSTPPPPAHFGEPSVSRP